MHSAAWAKLFRHIPASEQPKLMLVTSGGTEIAIQCLLRIDPECLALKGRLAGSQDAGRVFFIPYSHIDYLGFQQPVKESEFHELFGTLDLAAINGHAAPAPAPQPAAAPAATSGPPLRNPRAIKSVVLEKFRARSQSNPSTAVQPPRNE